MNLFQNLNPYPKYRNIYLPWLSKFPAHWENKRGKRVLSIVDERSSSGDEELLTVSSKHGVVPRSSQKVTMFKAADYSGYKLTWPNDLVINSLWAWGNGLGVSRHHGIVSTAYGVYRPELNEVNPDFLHLYVRSLPFNWELTERSRGIWTSRLQLTDDRFLTAPFILPPLEEQEAIVRYLAHAHQRIDSAIATKRRLISLLSEQRSAIARQIVLGRQMHGCRLRESNVSWIGKIPESWRLVPLRYLSQIGNGSTPSRSDARYWEGGSHPWLNSSVVNQREVTVADQFVTDTALHECHLPNVPTGSVLVGITGQGRTRGMAALLTFDATINQHLAFIAPDETKLNNRYLTAILDNAYQELRRISDGSGSTKGALTITDLKSFYIPLPDLDEQREIVARIEAETAVIDKKKNLAEREIKLLEEFKTRLTADVVTGQLDVREIAATLPPLDVLPATAATSYYEEDSTADDPDSEDAPSD